MRLGLGGARPDGGPADDIGEILRDDGIEELGGGGQTEGGDFQKDLAGQAQSRGEIARIVHARVVDQPLPPDSRAGLLEVNAHEDAERIPQLGAQSGEPAGVVEGTFRIVDRTRTDDGEEAGVASVQDGLRFRTPLGHGGERGSADRQFLFDHFRRDEALQAAHARVFEGAG